MDEKTGWHQGHSGVPLVGYYFPSIDNYDEQSSDVDKRLGILEIPVSRKGKIGSFTSILNPKGRTWKKITKWVMSNQNSHPKVITVLFHNWNVHRANVNSIQMKKNFSWSIKSFLGSIYNDNFLTIFDNMLKYYKKNGYIFVTLWELKTIIEKEI